MVGGSRRASAASAATASGGTPPSDTVAGRVRSRRRRRPEQRERGDEASRACDASAGGSDDSSGCVDSLDASLMSTASGAEASPSKRRYNLRSRAASACESATLPGRREEEAAEEEEEATTPKTAAASAATAAEGAVGEGSVLLLKAAVVALSPLPVSMLMSVSVSLPPTSSPAPRPRLVGRRRIDIDAGADAQRQSSLDSNSEDQRRDEQLLDESLEQSYWLMYKDCEYKDSVLRLCRQADCVGWEEALSVEMMDSLRKVGEGVYGQVFSCRRGRRDVALKLFPIEGPHVVNGEQQKMFHEVLPELLISKKLTNLAYRYRSNRTSNFAQLLDASIVRGPWHRRLAEAADDAEGGGANGDELRQLPQRQQWLVLQYQFAGQPLPEFKFNCYREARSVILQLALSLAAAEAQFQFEHRDLHWENVLVRRTPRDKIRYRVRDSNYAVDCHGVEVAIIDFTVSRVSPAPGYVLYIDMSNDEDIFVGDGDYQYEVYRMMRRECDNDWRRFNPRTNLMWLHYLLDKLLTATAFPRRDPDCLPVQSELTALHDCLLTYASCQQLVAENFYFMENALDSAAD